MKHSLLLAFIAVASFASCKDKDKGAGSLTSDYCDCMTRLKDLARDSRIDSCDQLILADTLSAIESDSAATAFLDQFDASLQAGCKEYKTASGEGAAADNAEDEGDWKEVDTSLASKLSADDCRAFFDNQSFHYTEQDTNASTTVVTIENGVWNESLAEGKFFSKLSFIPGDCAFTLSFIQSDDPVKGRRSKKGESYRYRLIEKKGDHYLVLGIVKGKGLLFRLYTGS